MTLFKAALLGLFIALGTPLGAAAQDTIAQPSGKITMEDSAQKDAAIAVRIREILGELDGYEDVTVTVSSGIVTLRGQTPDATTLAQLGKLVGRVDGVVAIRNDVHETTNLAQRLNPAVSRFAARIKQLVALLPLLLVALVVFGLFVAAGFWLARRRQPWDRIAPNAFIADIIRLVIRLAFLLGGLVVALDILGAVALLSTVLGAAGIIGLALGFAVRDTVENFIASIMLSIRQPFRPNDLIEIQGDKGKVIRLTSRATILLSLDGNHIRIPNAVVFKNRIINYTRNLERRLQFDETVAWSPDLAEVLTAGQTALAALPFVLKVPAPQVWIEGIAADKATLRFTAWINQHDTSLSLARSEAMRVVDMALRNAEAGAATKPGKAGPGSAVTLGSVTPADNRELEQIIDLERAGTAKSDLLNTRAPEE